MKILINISKLLFLLSAFPLIIACERQGCTDMVALNYNTKASKNDRSCEYSTISFKVDEANFGYDSVTNSWSSLYINGGSIGAIFRSGSREFALQNSNQHKYFVESTVYDSFNNVYVRIDSGAVQANPNTPIIEVNLFD